MNNEPKYDNYSDEEGRFRYGGYLKEFIEGKKLLIGLDTYDRSKGEFKYSPDLSENSQSGMEFLIEISNKDNGKLLVQPGYNIYNGKDSSYSSNSGTFEEVQPNYTERLKVSYDSIRKYFEELNQEEL